MYDEFYVTAAFFAALAIIAIARYIRKKLRDADEMIDRFIDSELTVDELESIPRPGHIRYDAIETQKIDPANSALIDKINSLESRIMNDWAREPLLPFPVSLIDGGWVDVKRPAAPGFIY